MHIPSKTTVAIIGGGIAGLTAGYLLHQKYDVTLFERSERVGGNAYSLRTPDGREVDIAAAVFGKFSYINMSRLFRRLNVSMSGPFWTDCLHSSCLGASFQNLETKKGMYLTPGIRALLAQRFEILRPHNVKSMLQLMTGLRTAETLLKQGALEGLTVDQMLSRVPDITGNAKLIFLCCLCLISSMHCEKVLDAPAEFFVQKLKVYHDFMPPKALFSVQFAKNGTKSAMYRPCRRLWGTGSSRMPASERSAEGTAMLQF